MSFYLNFFFFFLNWLFSFSGTQNGVRGSHVVMTAGFCLKNIFSKNGENRPSLRLFECVWKLVIIFFLNGLLLEVSINCCTPGNVLEKFGIKMFLTNQMAGFLNRLYLWNEKMKKPEFLHVDTNSVKLKVDWKILGWAWS